MNTQQSQPESSRSEGVTQLDFNQAMADFRTMFPNMDVEVIEAVLRENQGVVDATIDSLLAMTTDNELEVTRRCNFSPDETSSTERTHTPPPSYSQVVPAVPDESLIRPLSPRGTNPLAPFAKQGILGTPMRYSRGWKPALLGPLPPDFLRIERTRLKRLRTAMRDYSRRAQTRRVRHRWLRRELSYRREMRTLATVLDPVDVVIDDEEDVVYSQDNRASELLPSGRLLLQRFDENSAERDKDSGNSPQAQQLLDDERLALLLQSAEFVSALRNDRDFMQTLDTEQPGASAAAAAAAKSTETLPEPQTAGAIGHLRENDDEAVFREKLRNMGRVSRRKFAQLARVFFKGRRPLGGGVTTKDRPILCDEDDDWSFVDQQQNASSSGSTLNKSRIP